MVIVLQGVTWARQRSMLRETCRLTKAERCQESLRVLTNQTEAKVRNSKKTACV